MRDHHWRIGSVVLVVALSCACATAGGTSGRVTSGAGAAAGTARRDTHEGLNNVLWMQTSAEFWALTTSAYSSAQVLLERALKERTWSAALEQTAGFESLPPAVILDLDETVLDNSPAQAQIALERTVYDQSLWTAWVEKMTATAIPGAQSFLAFAAKQGVKVFFVTNRTAAEQPATLKNLAALGIAAADDTVLSAGENGWTTDKTARRAQIAKSYRVLLLVGDDMNDFVATTKLTPAQRVELAKKHADRWGRSWILLPNPMYGSWERAIFAGLTSDEEILQRKREQLKGFRP